jgi:hypothetical protein
MYLDNTGSFFHCHTGQSNFIAQKAGAAGIPCDSWSAEDSNKRKRRALSLDILTLESDPMLPQNVRIQLPSNAASYSRRTESSAYITV